MAKILLVIPSSSPFVRPLAKAFRGLNHQVEIFDNRSGIIYTSRAVRRSMRLLPSLRVFKKWHIQTLNKNLLSLGQAFKPDLLFVVNGENISPETIAKFKNNGTKTANWFLDLLSHWTVIKKIAPTYDFFFSPDNNVLESLKKEGVENATYLPYAVELPGPANLDKKYGITFIGSYSPTAWPERPRLLSALKDFDLHIWGPPTWKDSPLKDFYHEEARGQKMFSIYQQSKIVLDIPWLPENFKTDATGTRPFEVMGAGACLFYYSVRPDMPRLFKETEDYVGFTNADELRSKAKEYLANSERRETVAKSGYEKIKSAHTYRARVEQILQYIKK